MNVIENRHWPLHAEEASLHSPRILNLLDPYRIRPSFPSAGCLPTCESNRQTPCSEREGVGVLSIMGQTLD